MQSCQWGVYCILWWNGNHRDLLKVRECLFVYIPLFCLKKDTQGDLQHKKTHTDNIQFKMQLMFPYCIADCIAAALAPELLGPKKK